MNAPPELPAFMIHDLTPSSADGVAFAGRVRPDNAQNQV